jgi:ribonuclease III
VRIEEEPVGGGSGGSPEALDTPGAGSFGGSPEALDTPGAGSSRDPAAPEAKLRELLDQLPAELSGPVFTHASWTSRRSDSYERLAFLGDSVLALAITAHLYPRLQADRFGAGRLTKIRAQAVSGRSCRSVAERLGVPKRLLVAAPPEVASSAPALIRTERVLASVIEAVIGACYLAFGYERTATAVVEAFEPEVEEALEHPVDFKSALQERLARRGELVSYSVADEHGPPHDPTFSISATIEGVEVGRGTGRSKKDAEQEAAQAALEALEW